MIEYIKGSPCCDINTNERFSIMNIFKKIFCKKESYEDILNEKYLKCLSYMKHMLELNTIGWVTVDFNRFKGFRNVCNDEDVNTVMEVNINKVTLRTSFQKDNNVTEIVLDDYDNLSNSFKEMIVFNWNELMNIMFEEIKNRKKEVFVGNSDIEKKMCDLKTFKII